MANTNWQWGRVITYAGAFIAFLIGSGFAKGQEVVQYFSAYGWQGAMGIAVVMLLFVYVGREFVLIGKAENVQNSGDMYTFLCAMCWGGFLITLPSCSYTCRLL